MMIGMHHPPFVQFVLSVYVLISRTDILVTTKSTTFLQLQPTLTNLRGFNNGRF